MKTRFHILCLSMRLLAVSLLAVSNAHADMELRGEVFCFPAEKVPDLVEDLSEVDKDRRDVVDVGLEPKFLIKDGGDWPERFFIRTDEKHINVPVEKPSGRTPTFLSAATKHSDGDVCVKDKTRADRPKWDEGLYFEMGLAPIFHNTSGRHDLAELEEGTKDGKSFYKKMIPPIARMFMQDTDRLAVRYNDFRKTAELYAEVDGQEVPLESELYKDMHVIEYDVLEDMNADALIIKGGAYQLQPTVSIKTMKRFGYGEDVE